MPARENDPPQRGSPPSDDDQYISPPPLKFSPNLPLHVWRDSQGKIRYKFGQPINERDGLLWSEIQMLLP